MLVFLCNNFDLMVPWNVARTPRSPGPYFENAYSKTGIDNSVLLITINLKTDTFRWDGV